MPKGKKDKEAGWSNLGWWIERGFRLVEMTGVLALLKVVLEPAYPGVAIRVVVVGSIAVAYLAMEPIAIPESWRTKEGKLATALVVAQVVAFLLAILAIAGIVLRLAELIATYAGRH